MITNRLLVLLLCLMGIHYIDASEKDYGKIRKGREITRVSPIKKVNIQERKLQCSKCNFIVVGQRTANLDRHILTVHKINPRVCPRDDCQQGFANQTSLREHLLQGHGVTKKKLAQYMMVDSRQSDDNDLMCPDCDMTFARKWRSNLNRHLLQWHNINPFFCMNNACLQNFASNAELQAHRCTPSRKKSPAPIALDPVSAASSQICNLTIDSWASNSYFFTSMGCPDYSIPLRISSFSKLNIASNSDLETDENED